MNITHSSVRSTRDQVYYLLKEEIMKFRLIPGSHISEKEISEKYEVSRTPHCGKLFFSCQKKGCLKFILKKERGYR